MEQQELFIRWCFVRDLAMSGSVYCLGRGGD